MAARKRVQLRPKSLLNQNGSSRTKSSTASRDTGNKAINNSDFTLYLRLSLLIFLALAVGGFLLYPDLLNIMRTVRDQTSNNAHLSEDKLKSQKDDLLVNTQHFSQDEDEDAKLSPDEDEDVELLNDINTDEDLMEDEEADKKIEQFKTSQTNKIKMNNMGETNTSQKRNLPPEREPKSEETDVANERPSDKSSRSDANSRKEQTAEPQKDKSSQSDEYTKQEKIIKQKKDKTLSSHTENKQEQPAKSHKDKTSTPDVNIKQESTGTLKRDKNNHKTGPIILNAQNNNVVLDPSQIKIVEFSSNKNVDNKYDSSKKTKVTSENKDTSQSKSATTDKAEKATSKVNEDKRQQNKASTGAKSEMSNNNKEESNKTEILDDIAEEAKKFKPTFQKSFTPKKIFADGRRIPPVELLHQKKSNSSVRIFLFDDFLSQQECTGLIKAHDSHVKALDKPPILCFDSIATLRKHIKDVKKKIEVTPNDFTTGTKCVNASFSLQLQTWMKSNWSYSTAFYPGESTFSKFISYRIKEAMGLEPASGGKFQITSYPEGKAYKAHTDCSLGGVDQRDRVVSVLMYLSDVEEGGETTFPELGIWVRPKKGRALVWNNMSPDGVCEEHSNHIASVVKKGSKYILIRWYYYKTFYSLGRRPPPPHLPQRDPGQPMVHCDEYNSGSCRWYDEWSYEPLMDYEKNRYTLI